MLFVGYTLLNRTQWFSDLKVNYTLRIILVILATITLLSYVLLSSKMWLMGFDKHLEIRDNPYYSQNVDLSKEHVFTWKIESNVCNYNKGIAKVLLVFERTPEMTGNNYWNKDFALKVKINAYAVTENNINAPRLIQNFFYPTDEPMSNETKLWSGWSDQRMEYLLGLVTRFPKEDLYIDLTILSPDFVLAKANPRLKIVGNYDDAAIGHLFTIWLICDIAIILCLFSLGFLAIQAWRFNVSKKNEG